MAGKRTRRRYRVADLSAEALEKELRRLERQQGRGHWLWGTLIAFVLALVVGALAASRFLMIATVHGNSMSPTLENGSVVVCLRGSETERGALALFEYEDSLLIKRVIALGGDTVEIDRNGTLKVNGDLVAERYLKQAGAGESDVVYPLKVPEGELFVMGDHRGTSVDSRSRIFGTVPAASVVARPKLVAWPVYGIAWLGN